MVPVGWSGAGGTESGLQSVLWLLGGRGAAGVGWGGSGAGVEGGEGEEEPRRVWSVHPRVGGGGGARKEQVGGLSLH